MNCVICDTVMDDVLTSAGYKTHPNCFAFDEPAGEDPFSVLLKHTIIDKILWADKENPRSKQVKIGPSEIGSSCDRKIGYRLAQIPPVNVDFDPWAAIVGTAVHAWLEKAMTAWMTAHSSSDWATETDLKINDFVDGHADLYWHTHKTVIDYKTAGPEAMRKLRMGGQTRDDYIIQTHVYGYGFEQAGYEVRKVALMFLPRAGRLQDSYVWSADYSRELAEAALARSFAIAQQVVSLNILTESHRWEQVDATPSNACGLCPWYNSTKDRELGAGADGCPGR